MVSARGTAQGPLATKSAHREQNKNKNRRLKSSDGRWSITHTNTPQTGSFRIQRRTKRPEWRMSDEQ